ncbi:MAG: imidazole glycerol phosphate synthase subunit HisH [Erysipelotrichaceae bacterium]|jgi:glutamine amidotransferase|nr:imidazole glycerol phosphate synthase subunit HisH [Erysipelotrichaceae bacterium]
MIGIIDYGMGNLASVSNALYKIKQESCISSDPQILKDCDRLILPGVGAFGDCMANLQQRHLDAFILDQVSQAKPLLGICLGMQMLFEESEEKGTTKGLGLLKGNVVMIDDPSVPIPEIGWNDLIWNHGSALAKELPEKTYVYYVHSYYAKAHDEDLLAYSMYGNVRVAGIVQQKHVMGTQFHPEKSGRDGLRILKYFAEEFQ